MTSAGDLRILDAPTIQGPELYARFKVVVRPAAGHPRAEDDMPDEPSQEPQLDPIDVEPTDNSSGALVDLDRVQQTEDEYRQRRPEDTSQLL